MADMDTNQPPQAEGTPAQPAPIVDVAPPPAPQPAPQPTPDVTSLLPPEEVKSKQPKPPKPPKQPGTGVGAAIFATVVIVLGLSAIAAFAYMQTVK